MASKNDDTYVIWPRYFDSSLSREQGRRVARKYAIEKPTIEVIAKAAKSLKLNPIVENKTQHPATPSKKAAGRVLVDKKGSKSELLVQLAKRFG